MVLEGRLGMAASGGVYSTMPMSLLLPAPNYHPLHREPHPPFATQYGPMRPRRISSAPARRISAPWRKVEVGPTNPHRPSSALAHTRTPSESWVTKGAPFASRMSDTLYSNSNQPKGGAVLPGYDSLHDPHLHDYFMKKFANPRPPNGTRRSSSRPSSRPGSAKSGLNMGKTDVLYKVAVTTGKRKDAGTDAKVHLRMNGTKGKFPRHLLTKKLGTTKNGKKIKFKFNKRTTHVFKLTGKDIGDLISITIEHDGLTKEQGWLLERVEIVKKLPRTGKEKCWVFECGQWLSLHVGDCQISRQLFAKRYTKTEYEVVAVTGNKKGAGTDANVFVTIYGKHGSTPKLELKNNSKNCFERGHSDIFNLTTVAVGPQIKIRIQHDNTGFAPGWFLDRVVVTDLKNPKCKYYFPCGTWLAKDEGDGAICRDLVGSRDPLAVRKPNKYKVTVYTADKRGAGTDANVYLTMFGESGDTGEKKLDNSQNNFERGRMDEFIIECASVGRLQRIRIGHDNRGPSAGWFLEKVIVDDLDSGRVYEFLCQRWLAKDEDDGAISRELFCSLGPGDGGVPYNIHVMTADVAGAGTSARVYVVLFGGKNGEECSGKIWLEDGKYSRGRTDIFNVEVGKMLSPLSKIEIGHDNSGAGAGWYLDKVMVGCPSGGIEQWFLCDKWLADDEGDGLIERTLYESKGLRKTKKKTTTWNVFVYTTDQRGAGTDANVQMVLYGKTKDGEYKKSDDIMLDNKGDNFESGQCDRFKVEIEEVGKPYKLRVCHDNSGSFAGWHLDRVEMENMVTKKQYIFHCKRWLAKDEDDGCIVREMAAEGEDIKKPQPSVKYNVQVHTGKKFGAGTDANVFLNIFGEQGDTGERPLDKSRSHRNKFEKGNVEENVNQFEKGTMDEFIVDAVTLKKLKKIRIGHDGTRAGDGWFLDKVVVKQQDDPDNEMTFECNRWLDVKEDDGLIVREITAGGSQMLNTTSYHVSVKTGDVWGAGTDANVYIKIFGENGDTGTLDLKSADNTKNKFEKGRTDLFKLEATDIGKIERIRIGHDGANPGSGWFLDEVRIDVPSRGWQYVFACHRWLDTKEEDGQLELELDPTHFQQGSVKIPYEVTVWTGDMKGAGTDANVFVQMYGEYGKTEEYQLRNRTDNFEQNEVDKFKIEAEDVGPLTKIRIGHDGDGMFAGWFLDKLLIQRYPTKGSKRRLKQKKSSFKEIRRGEAPSDSEDDDRSHRRGRISNRRGSKYHGKDDEYSDDGYSSRRGRDGKDRRSSSLARKGSRHRSDDYSDEEHYNRREKGMYRRGSMPARSSRDRRRDWDYSDDDHTPRKDQRRRMSKSVGRYSDESEEDGPRGKMMRRSSSAAMQRKIASRYSDESEEDGRRGKGKHRSSSAAMRRKSASRYSDESEEDGWRGKAKRRPSSAAMRRKYQDDSEDERSAGRSKSRKERYDSEDSEDERKSKKSPRRKGDSSKGRRIYDSEESEDERPGKGGRRKSSLRKARDKESDPRSRKKNSFMRKPEDRRRKRDEDEEEETEDYWFVCRRWFAKGEDDGKIVRELLPTDEHGQPLDTGLQEIEYEVIVYTGDVFGAGTDANIFINISGEHGDTGERDLSKSDHINKFERNQEDVFKLKAIELGRLRKVKIRHDNKGGGAAWFLGHVEVVDPVNRDTYFFPCQRWLAVNEDDGQIARELVPVDKSLKNKLGQKDSQAIRNEVALETKAAMTTYHVYVHTGDKWGAGTDANVYVTLFGEQDDTGTVFLKSSKTNKNKFERNKMDEFIIEAVDIGDLKKLKIGHDNAGGGGAWYLDRVEIDCPSLGTKWMFPCGRWLAKDEDDGKLERELYPQQMATEEYTPCIPYEITTYTSDVSGASTDADVFVVLYGKDTVTQQKSLCANKKERKKCYERGQADKFVVELEDVGRTIEKIRIGHDGSGWGAGWHLDKVEVRRLKDSNKGSETYTFACGRWLARGEDDGAIVRELVADKVVEELMKKDGSMKRREKDRRDTLVAKKYQVSVITGDVRGGGTDANVFLTIFGDKGDTGERKLHKSETHRDKFERNQTDVFSIEAADLGKIHKVKIRHDNSLISPAWFLDHVEVVDTMEQDHYVFHCERWMAKNKDDGKIERTLYVKGYDGDMSSTSTLKSTARLSGSVGSIDSLRSTDPFSKSPRLSRRHPSLEEIPEGPTIPYTVKVVTGEEKDMGTESNAWVKIYGPKKKHTGRLYLELAQKKEFAPGSMETFSIEALEMEEVRQIEIGHDGVTPGSGWFVKEVELDLPTKGKHYYFTCKQWLARDKGDGKTSRIFTLNDGDTSCVSYKPLVPYELTVHTGDIKDAGTDCQIFIKVFGANGSSSEIYLDKNSDRFERARSDLIKIELEDIAPIKKLRIGHNGKGQRSQWYCEKVELRNMDTMDLYVFKCGKWFTNSKEEGAMLQRDLVATVHGKAQLKTTTYRLHVKTSDTRGAGTDANVYVAIFGADGDSGDLHLKKSETNKKSFENNQTDVFSFEDLLSLGPLIKVRVWHDNKGLGAAWHLAHIEVEDVAGRQKYMFPCNRWLSKSDDDKQICRELSCANMPSPGGKDKITYEIAVTTTDKKDAGMIHNAWLILEGEQRSSKEFLMENSAKAKVLRRGQTDIFTMVSRNLGRLEKCILGAVEREDKPLTNLDGREAMWHCHEVVITNKVSRDKYTFACKAWIPIAENISKKQGKMLTVKAVEESRMSTIRTLGTVKYEVTVVTGDIRSAGTDANISITIYGTNGDTGKRPLTQKMRNLFERGQTDQFQLEAVDLGEVTKIQIEHDNSGWGAGWFLERVEITNMASNHHWVFPCGQWLDKKKGDGQIMRELLPRD